MFLASSVLKKIGMWRSFGAVIAATGILLSLACAPSPGQSLPVTVTPLPSTPTPQPGVTAAPSPTFLPTAAQPSGDTPPGAVLVEGETWRSQGVALKFERIKYNTGGWFLLRLYLKNDTGSDLSFSYGPQNFIMVDNLDYQYDSSYCFKTAGIQEIKAVVHPGEGIYLGDCTQDRELPIGGDWWEPRTIPRLDLTVTGLPMIVDARWTMKVRYVQKP
jgi:hypothetical protein